ncbi:transposase [Chloroflexota bacterium]|nr:transposase [Chloroflexota bacterium]
MAAERNGQSSKNSSSKPSQNDWEHISSESIEGGIIQGSTWQPLAEIVLQEEDLVSILQEDFDAAGNNTADRDWRAAAESPNFPISATVKSQVDTQPVRINPALENWTVGVEIPVASAITFYLAPRQTKHFLIGGLSRQLRTWMPELCETYGWELDFLSVRPDYLKWSLRDFPEPLTRDMLQTVREKTSLWIFRVFPNLKEGADSTDFWAPGYLVDNKNRDFTTRALMAQVAQDRLGGKTR